MSKESLTYALIFVAVIVIGWLLVRYARRPTRDDGPARILERGWQFYSKPTTLEPPGSVFRIDAEGRKYEVGTLTAIPKAGDEAFGRHRESIAANTSMLARFLDVNLKAQAQKTDVLIFEMNGAVREVLDDADVDAVIDAFLQKLRYRADNRYFLIRESRRATEMTYHLTRSQVDELGGSATLASKAKLEGTMFKADRGDEFLLQQKFAAPMRVMFLTEEIKPITAALAAERQQLGLVPVAEPLVWEEGET